MDSRRILIALVAGLVLLGVSFAVLMAFHSLVSMLGDAAGAKAIFWAAMICLIGLCVDLVLLVAALGFRAAQTPHDRDS